MDWARKHILELTDAFRLRLLDKDASGAEGLYARLRHAATYPQEGHEEGMREIIKAVCALCKETGAYPCAGRSGWLRRCVLIESSRGDGDGR